VQAEAGWSPDHPAFVLSGTLSPTPKLRLLLGVGDREDDTAILKYFAHDCVRKMFEQSASNMAVRAVGNSAVPKRVLLDRDECVDRLDEKSLAQTRPLAFIPSSRGLQFRICFRERN
jgi:hypothetical protein